MQEGEPEIHVLINLNPALTRKMAEAPTPLADHDELKIGSVVMIFRVFEPSETESER